MQVANTPTYDGNTKVSGAYKVNTSAGRANTTVSSQWYTRPADQRFLDLDSLYDSVRKAHDESYVDVIEAKDIRVQASREDHEDLKLVMPDDDLTVVAPTNWSFGQVCSLVGVPAGYLRKLPASIAGINLQYGLSMFREEAVKAYVRKNGKTELRAATGPTYGRIYDYQIVEAVRKVAGSGRGEQRWKVPGVLDWSNGTYNPFTEVTAENTTLFASDRDVFMFLVDDTHPIEIGKLPNGDPDLVFRGFYTWNSEVGSKSAGIATFYLRAICQNRILWGVEGFEEVTIRHSAGAPERFAKEAEPALLTYANNSTDLLLRGIKSAREAVVAKTDDDRVEFLGRKGFNRSEAKRVIDAVLQEEGKPAESIWDFVQGITAVARTKPNADDRVEFEGRAKKLLDKVAA